MQKKGVFAELVNDLHYAGVREVSSQCLHFILKMVSAQVLPETGSKLQSCVSPFNMLHFMEQHPLANHKMLESVCLAQAFCSEKAGRDLLQEIIGEELEPLQPFHDGRPKRRVGFYGEHLFKVGLLNDLVVEAIVTLSRGWSEQFEVLVFGAGTESDKSQREHPPLKELWAHFKQESRISLDAKVADAREKL